MSKKKGFLNPLLSTAVKKSIKDKLHSEEWTLEEMLIEFIGSDYRVTFKEIPDVGAIGVNIVTDRERSGNIDWILSDFHDTPEEALARCYYFNFFECAECPWSDANSTVHVFADPSR